MKSTILSGRIVATVFLTVVIAGPVGCGSASLSSQQVEAVAEIKKMGGDFQGAEDLVHHLAWTGRDVTDEELVHVKELTGLHYLNLRGTSVTDAGIEHLGGLTGLQFLDLSGTQVTDDGLVHLHEMAGLQFLWLLKTQVTDTGTDELRQKLTGCTIEN